MASTRLPKAYTFCHSLTKTYVTATRIKGYRDKNLDSTYERSLDSRLHTVFQILPLHMKLVCLGKF